MFTLIFGTRYKFLVVHDALLQMTFPISHTHTDERADSYVIMLLTVTLAQRNT